MIELGVWFLNNRQAWLFFAGTLVLLAAAFAYADNWGGMLFVLLLIAVVTIAGLRYPKDGKPQ